VEKNQEVRKMSVILGIIFSAIVMGSGIWRGREAFSVFHIPLSRIDEKTLVLELK
jgi:hypothetical protein